MMQTAHNYANDMEYTRSYGIMEMYLNPMHYLKSHKCQEICKSRKIMYIAQTDADGTDTHECMKMTQMQQNDSDATKLCRRHGISQMIQDHTNDTRLRK